jgi:hypothetical protein
MACKKSPPGGSISMWPFAEACRSSVADLLRDYPGADKNRKKGYAETESQSRSRPPCLARLSRPVSSRFASSGSLTCFVHPRSEIMAVPTSRSLMRPSCPSSRLGQTPIQAGQEQCRNPEHQSPNPVESFVDWASLGRNMDSIVSMAMD